MGERFESHVALLRKFISEQAEGCLKGPAHYLKYPFIDPGSVYSANLWDWDSFWSTYALLNLEGDLLPQGSVTPFAKGNIHNFFDHQMDDGYIPMMIEKGQTEEPYLIGKRKEGVLLNMHKPFLSQHIALISGHCNDYEWARTYIDGLEKYFACYDRDYYNENCNLYVWADDIMIGMDNDPATFGRPKFSTANIYLNSFMVSEMKAMSLLCGEWGLFDRQCYYNQKAQKLEEAIQAECWDPRDKFFYSVDVDIKTRQFDWFHTGLGVFWKTLPIKVRAWTGFIPLWSGTATVEQSLCLSTMHLADKNTFNSPYGVPSLAMDEKMYNISATNNPSNWLGPIWGIVNYVAFRGLMNYGYREEAEIIARKSVELFGGDLERSGTLHEYYDPASGKPVMNGGFLNWNMLVLNMVSELADKPALSRHLRE
ncbi:putative isomerase [Paenibacillus anaericanus]|uniref:MGH1-like glycoside hydrolase domain-containing protein n=1 Tax=Paenibacillus anaericanus TaxID=170367 RepID=UPI00277EACDB|nr:trehalase family glycosidase [Paenibacillus anaericanus]MDQ0091554.1 putative isomerase [Paenibacillus anaericanus]